MIVQIPVPFFWSSNGSETAISQSGQGGGCKWQTQHAYKMAAMQPTLIA